MTELTLLLLRIGFLVLLWFFIFAVVYSLRADLFGVRARKMPEAEPARPANPAKAKTQPHTGGDAATTNTVSRIVITSGPKAGLEIPLGDEPLTIGRSRESGLVIRDDFTSSHHARLVLWGEQWMIQDLDSTNGTWHDGEKVLTPTPIRAGAPVKVGATVFELRK